MEPFLLEPHHRPLAILAAEAGDGVEALDRLRAAAQSGVRRDLVLVDLQSPGMDGSALAEAMAADSTLAG